MKIENDLGRDDIKKLVLRIAIPSMLAQFVNVYRKYSGDWRAGIGRRRNLRPHCNADYIFCHPGRDRRGAAFKYPIGSKGRKGSKTNTGQLFYYAIGAVHPDSHPCFDHQKRAAAGFWGQRCDLSLCR